MLKCDKRAALTARFAVMLLCCFLVMLAVGNSACALREPLSAPVSGLTTPPTVQVEATADVAPASVAEVRQAVAATQAFFVERTGLRLEKTVTLVLVADRKAFIAEVMNRFHLNELDAQRTAKGTDALAGAGLIILDVSGTPTTRQRTFLTAHELTHQYQRGLAKNQAGQVKWLLEGMAETVGAQVVDRQGYFRLNQYRDNWQGGLRATPRRPGLEELVTAQGWANSIDRYGSPATYKTAGLAVLLLADQRGLEKVCDYFIRLGKQESPEDAFFHAFGRSLTEYMTEYERQMLRPAS